MTMTMKMTVLQTWVSFWTQLRDSPWLTRHSRRILALIRWSNQLYFHPGLLVSKLVSKIIILRSEDLIQDRRLMLLASTLASSTFHGPIGTNGSICTTRLLAYQASRSSAATKQSMTRARSWLSFACETSTFGSARILQSFLAQRMLARTVNTWRCRRSYLKSYNDRHRIRVRHREASQTCLHRTFVWSNSLKWAHLLQSIASRSKEESLRWRISQKSLTFQLLWSPWDIKPCMRAEMDKCTRVECSSMLSIGFKSSWCKTTGSQ